MRKKYPIYLILSVIVFAGINGCITEFEPKGIEEVSDLLIVEGTITDGESIIKLRHSVGLSEILTGKEYLDGASMFVETEDGDIFQGVSMEKGTYIIPTGSLNPNKKYRLNISLGGEQYQSDYLSPLITPEIDSISPIKKGEGQPVFMCVNTHDPQSNSRYYRWSYRETWEVKAELFANALWVDGSVLELNLHTSNNIYYCWGRDSSKVLLLGSTEKLTENIVSEKRLVEIPCNNDRLSIMYHIEVEQMQIRKETYDYWSNLQKNIEQTGSIFTPMPSEMKGNIRCISTPELPVIGYMEVATITKKDRYFPENAGLYEAPKKTCGYLITDDPDYAPPNYYYYEYYPPKESYAPRSCVDCRIKEKASKNRPENWPTNHL